MNLPNKTNKQLGFSLIELLVVISVIGFLVSSITYATAITRMKSRDASRKQAAAEIRKGLDLYFQANGTYPATGGITPVIVTSLAPQLKPTFMSTLYNDPSCPTGAASCNYLYITNSSSSPSEYGLYIPFERIPACRFTSPGSSLNFTPAVSTCNY